MIDPSTVPLPLGFHEWIPAWQAALFAILTLVQEDAPTVGAAVLASQGHLSWTVGFLGCFLGIWTGDVLLYLLARVIGRPLLQTRWGKRWVRPDKLKRSEEWFHRCGWWILAACRFAPGTRLPTYLAAGFAALPWARFILVTGVSVLVWTLGLFSAAYFVGPTLLALLKRAGLGIGTFLLAGLILWGIIRWARQRLRRKIGAGPRWLTLAARLRRWEFWPAPLFYAPVVLGYIGLALRHRSLLLPTAANPGIFAGGIVGESKGDILNSLMQQQPEFTAAAWRIDDPAGEARVNLFSRLQETQRLGWPCVLKPDVGQRGAGVKIVRSEEDAYAYLRHTTVPLLAQRYAPGPFEAGIFYCRLPGEANGHIWAVTEKEFPRLTGDGRHTVEQLIWRHPRFRYQANTYLRRLESDRERILEAGETLTLVQAGNHAQGCIFRDGRRLITQALERRIDEISRSLDGFFIGRYDVRYASEEELRAGRQFLIVELNGAAAEATNIYDPDNPLWSAYRTLFRQWALVFRVAAANRSRGHRPLKPITFWQAWRSTSQQLKQLPIAD